MKIKIILAVAALAVVVGLLVVLPKKTLTASGQPEGTPAAAAVPAGDKQVMEIKVKEGYLPREITAKAGVPLLLKMKTQGTFDCSTAFNIPNLGIHERLEATGEKTIEIPAQKSGVTLTGVCGMGMYSLVIKFS